MSPADTQIYTARGRVNVRRTGDGPRNIVCLHPLASAGAFWDPIATYLATRATVWAPDARGHGRSEWNWSGFTVEDMADDVAALIHVVAEGPVGVIGMSMGGCVALALTLRHPDLVDSLALADTTSCYGPDRVEKWARRAHNARTKSRTEQVAFQVDRWFTERFTAAEPDAVQRVVDIFLATKPAAHAAACEALGAFDCDDRLGDVRVPTQILVGELDQATPRPMSENLHAQIPGASLDVLSGAKHLSLIEKPDAWPLLARAVGTERNEAAE